MEEDDFISKTRRKKQMHALQDVGSQLVALSADELARIRMPESLREAVEDARRFTRHEARRRQMQYIGRLMRDIDAAPIAEQLAAMKAPSRRQTALFHVAERWRQELLDDGTALERFMKEFPEADPDRLRTMVEEAREEKRAARAPRRFRELFHALSAIVQDHARREP
ncbi:MAG TPA: ribosome biogenesis factor YjgA [Usitatibacter sp.]|jgi:ribosome-associated protein|nr:ribosome biogenesis factor YjgA [Usitatibacter sp.]